MLRRGFESRFVQLDASRYANACVEIGLILNIGSSFFFGSQMIITGSADSCSRPLMDKLTRQPWLTITNGAFKNKCLWRYWR